MSAILVWIVVNFDALPGLLVAAVEGVLFGELLRTRSPQVYAGIGGVPETRSETPELIR
jgi:hypothetical protein